nr:MFS transporter [Neorhizobium tomejilense]
MLILDPRFAPLALAQFLTALNANFLKNALVFLILGNLPGIEGESAVALYSALFMMPMIFMSGLGGQLADRYDRGGLARLLKAGELAAVAVALVGIVMSSHLIVLCGVAAVQVIGSLFAPVRSSLIPLTLKPDEVPRANAWIEGCSFAAMIIGLWLVGAAFSMEGPARWTASAIVLALSAACFVAVNFIPAIEVAKTTSRVDLNLARSTWTVLTSLGSHRGLVAASGQLGWGWFVAALVLSTSAAMLARNGADTSTISACMIVYGVAGVVGSAVAARSALPRRTALAAGFSGMAVATLVMALSPSFHPLAVFAAAMALCSFSHGFVLVTCNTQIQTLGPVETKGRVAGGANVVNSLFMVLGGMGTAGFVALGVDLAAVYMFAGLVCAAVGFINLIPGLRTAV